MQKFSDNNILILGGCGYIGEAVCDALIRRGITPIAYDSLMFEDSYRKRGIKLVRRDVRDDKTLLYWLNRADAVINLVGIVGDGAATISPEVSLEINRERVKFISGNYKGRLFFASSCSVYGASDDLLTEESPTNPLSLYARSKLEAEKFLLDKDAIIYRFGTIFGDSSGEWGGFSRLRFDLVLNTLCARAFFENKLKVCGSSQFRPLLHVREAGEMIVSGLFNVHTGIYNLAYDNYTILQMAEIVQKYISAASIEITDIPTEDMRNYRVSCDKAKRDLNFCPQIYPEIGIKEMLSLFEEGRVKNWKDPRYYCWNFMKEKMPHLDENYPPNQQLLKEVEGAKISSVV